MRPGSFADGGFWVFRFSKIDLNLSSCKYKQTELIYKYRAHKPPVPAAGLFCFNKNQKAVKFVILIITILFDLSAEPLPAHSTASFVQFKSPCITTLKN